MWTWTSSVLLATVVVSGLSLPRPDDSQYDIPEVGTGRRSQYYVLHSDGTFKHGFDTGDGAFESVKSHSVGDRDGKFGYVDPDGKTIRVEYEAGEVGFVPRGDHLPKPSPEFTEAFETARANRIPFVDPLANGRSDASYGFEFQSDDHSRDEQSDADGTVKGSYSYVDEDGNRRSFNYRAGKGIGFVIEGDGLPQDSNVPTPGIGQAAGRRSYQPPRSSARGSHQVSRTHQTSTRKTQTPSRPRGAAVRASSTSFSGSDANIAFRQSQTPRDASYSFSYDAGDHSRSETADDDLNVDGTFSFVADDGNQRTVNYVAGSSTGFVAEGDHLPKAPDSDHKTQRIASRGHDSGSSRHQGFRSQTSHRTQSASSAAAPASVAGYYLPPTVSSTGGRTQTSTTRGAQTGAHRSSPSTRQRPFSSSTRFFEEANIRSSFSPAGPYSFSYDTSSHSRSESGDENNNVVGEFSFVADDDGERREIKYEAGSATGFIAEGDHIPVGPEVPGAPSGQPTGRIVPVQSVPFIDPLASSDTDASYNFDFESDTYSRTESSDKDGNIVGSYTVVDDDGTRRTYNFKAGEGIGYQTEEVSQSQGPAPRRPTSTIRSSQAGARGSSSTSFTHRTVQQPTSLYSAPSQDSRGSFTGSAGQSGRGVARPTTSFQPPTAHSRAISHSSIPQTLFRTSPPSVASSSSSSEFTLNRYDANPNSEKFGYVLRFN